MDVYNLTKEQAIEEHRKMWNWISYECLNRKCKVDKHAYFDKHPELKGGAFDGGCFLCTYIGNLCNLSRFEICSKCGCILNWPFDFKVSKEDLQFNCRCVNSRYRDFQLCSGREYERTSSIAREIAILEVNEKFEERLEELKNDYKEYL